jgi:hypothetical protein
MTPHRKTSRCYFWIGACITALALTSLSAQAQSTPGLPEQSKIINEELAKSWEAASLKPSKKADDYVFIRRAFIDIIGRIPTPEEVRDFAEYDKSPDKRVKLIKRLLYAKDYKPKGPNGGEIRRDPKDPKTALTFNYAAEYAQNFADVWNVWLLTRSQAHEAFREQTALWLEDQFSMNTPYDKFVTELITAKGKSNENGAVNFTAVHLGELNPRDKRITDGRFEAVPITARVSRLFLGIQINCIQCHDHPFNPEWKQENFWGMNAFYRQVQLDVRDPANPNNVGATEYPNFLRPNMNRKKDKVEMAKVVTVTDDTSLNPSTRVFYENRRMVILTSKPAFLPDLADLEKDASVPRKGYPNDGKKTRREVLAEYIVKHDNFARAAVNRYWSHFFGRGMNELPAPDDFGGHNKIIHKDLLDKLAAAFASGSQPYDIKKLIEWICCSDAYSLSYQANGLPEGKGGNSKADADAYFTRMPLKSMSPETLFESLETATRMDQATNKDAKREKKDRWMNLLIRNFGDDEGNEATFNGTIIQALLMMNGRDLDEEVRRSDSTVVKLMDRYLPTSGGPKGPINVTPDAPWKVIEDLYLATVSRKPSRTIMIQVPRLDPKGMPMKDSKGNVLTAPVTEEAFIKSRLDNLIKSGAKRDDLKAFYEDIFWSLLNTNEFILNH